MVGDRVELRWSASALRDLDRFAAFLLEKNPRLAKKIARAILAKVDVLADQPLMGRPIGGTRFRQVVLSFEGASYVLQYRFAKRSVTILRVHHSREERDDP